MDSFDSIICISQTPWEGTFQKAAVQLMTELAARHRVLYVDYPYTLKDIWLGLRGHRPVPIGRMLRWQDPLTRIELANNWAVHVWTPPAMLPINWLPNDPHDQLLRNNAGRLLTGLRSVMSQLKMKKPLIVNTLNPVLGLPMLGQLNEAATVYYCFDEITAGDWIGRHGYRYEQTYLQRVDAVVTTSEALRQTKSANQPNTFCVKNGANVALFHDAYNLARAQPPQRPVVGYLGSADNRIDIDIVEHCARTLPDVGFQFLGEVHEPLLQTRLAGLTNVEFLTPRPAAELPPVVAGWSAGMIPFICNDHTYTIYPLKINEYLAAGLPVVTTPFSPLDEFGTVIERANSPEAFVRAIRRALADTDPARVQARLNMARGNSWAMRAVEFEAVLDQLALPAVL
jgi:glycosyltransferase involved in cell wall biosynthesis